MEDARRAVRSAAAGRRRRAADALAAAGVDPEVPWSTTPFQAAPQARVDGGQRRELEARIRELAVEAVQSGVGDLEDGTAPGEGPSVDVEQAVAVACGACRGWCCRLGAAHSAFLASSTLRRTAAEFERRGAKPSVDGLVDAYVSHIGTTHVEGSCLFHGDRGCTLPRFMRSDVCNGYVCDEVAEVVESWKADGVAPEGHAFVAVSRRDRLPKAVRSLPSVPSSGLGRQSRANAASKAD
jgi:hypothetical protein